MENKTQQIFTRFILMGVDYFIVSFISIIVVIPFFIISLINKKNLLDTNSIYFWLRSLSMMIAYSIIMNKDIFDSRSPGKRIFKYQVLHNKTNLPASPIQCLLRNLTFIFWPIECLAILINPNRRLGDFIANTKVVKVDFPEKRIVKLYQITLLLFLGFCYSLLLMTPYYYLILK